MTISRTFLDWRQPALPAARDYLVQRYAVGGQLDLRSVAVVVPTSRARRRLLELLIDGADAAGLIFFPPTLVTFGPLPELLYEPMRPFASDLVQRLAWVEVLKQAGESSLRAILPRLPDENDNAGWLDLADLLLDQHRELAADGLNFGDVLDQVRTLEYHGEQPRWQALAGLQTAYLALLDKLGVWDMQTARLYAVEHRQCATDQDIVLVATADMNRVVRQMLDQVASQVTALVHAPQDHADRFDDYGCLEPAAWQHAPLDVAEEQVCVAEGPAEQAEAVARAIAAYEGKYAADEIVIGVPDERLAPHIQRQLAECNISTRWIVGRRVAETGPYRFLQAVAHSLGERRVADFAELVRHPDIDAWLTRRGIEGDWLTQLDTYIVRHLQTRLGDFLGTQQDYSALNEAVTAIDQLLVPLEQAGRSPLAETAGRLIDLLAAVYGEVEVDREDPTDRCMLEACTMLHDVLLDYQSTPEALMPAVTAAEAIELVLDTLSGASIAPAADVGQVEMFGWLELPLDERPALIVTSMNEGLVPKSVTSDHFLPDRLRKQLGLLDNVRRYARDCYALSVLCASRESLTLIVGRRNALGDPLNPSRLLLATQPDELAERALALFDPPSPKRQRPLAGTLSASRHITQIEVPLPVRLDKPISQISVSGFRSYLACPYRFYLGHVLRLQEIDDSVEELDAADFGTLVHNALSLFGRDEVRTSSDAETIQKFLERALERCVAARYGSEHLPAVRIQAAQARMRLNVFAQWQAERAAAGWEIIYSETDEPNPPYRLVIDGHELTVTGRIDRIDRHRESGETVIFDYKTSDSGKSPEKQHQKQGEWIDLQLPLYRNLALQSLGIQPPVRVGYIVLPKDTVKVDALLAEWTEEDFAAADEVALDVARRIVEQVFWPPTYPAQFGAEFAAICQDDVLQRNVPSLSVDAATS